MINEKTIKSLTDVERSNPTYKALMPFIYGTIFCMAKYSSTMKNEIRLLRSNGYTYTEIQHKLGQPIPKGSLSYICKDIVLQPTQTSRIQNIVKENLATNRLKAVAANRRRFEARLEAYRLANQDLKVFMHHKQAKLVALALLYLGEGAKWPATRSPRLGSSNSMIICLYITLLKECFDVDTPQLRCRIQYRADQDPEKLLNYWSECTGIPKKNFYRPYVDKRTIGQRTKKSTYVGVCTVMCAGTHIQLELEQITAIINDTVRGIGAVG